MNSPEPKMTEEELKAKHDTALKAYYEMHGVGDTTRHKLNFWRSKLGNYNISHNPSEEQEVRILEYTWLTDTYPEDFTFC